MSDAVPVSVPATATATNTVTATVAATGRNASAGEVGKANAHNFSRGAQSTAKSQATVDEMVQQLNKYLNDSGRANTFRVDPASRNQTIQEINPATGEVIGEFAARQFPALVRSLGISGVLVDSHA